MAKRRYVGVNIYNNDVTYYVITWVYREQWYVKCYQWTPSGTHRDNLLEAGCTNKLCPIQVKLPLLMFYLPSNSVTLG